MELKAREGKTVWLIPTGNTARSSKEGPYTSATLVKVARVNVVLNWGRGSEQKLRIVELRHRTILDDRYNGGYYVVPTEFAAKGFLASKKIGHELANSFSHGTLCNTDYHKLVQIAKILDVDIKEYLIDE